MMLNERRFIKHDVSPQNSCLMQVLHFTEEMLYANQAGVLTGPQRRYLRRRFMDHGYDLVLPFIAMLCLVAFDVFGYQGVCGSAFGFCVLVFGCIITFEGQFKVGRDLKNDRVECIKGAVHISRAETEFYGAASIYPYTIHALGSHHFFRVTRQVAAAFIEKDVYTL